ncbi:MAG: pyruvate kinase [Lentisphaerales bacterium]|jgi:pyruvate kinase|nr:MAG: pyruvate kinase [Lentisphaerales bacterium]
MNRRVSRRTRYVPRTKIICTLGPASSSESVLRAMVLAGMDIARINFSHGNRTARLAHIKRVRAINRKYRRHVRLLADLEGPRIRFSSFPSNKPVLLEKNRIVRLAREGSAKAGELPFDYPGSFADLGTAEYMYLDDGNMTLRIKSISTDVLTARVVVGGLLQQRKAINVPGADLKFPPISEQDLRDLEFAIEQKFDYVAQSFVRNANDILEIRRRLSDRLPACRVVAKIESRDGIVNLDSILNVSDAVMVARGDLGVSVPIYEVPLIQKEIIRKCNACGTMVITATQMLEHMVEYSRPTRAEATDIANAVLDGTDCVMLSAETAVGKYPVEAVTIMNDIIRYTEMNAPGTAANLKMRKGSIP